MTQVLLITNKSDITTDFIVRRLHERKIIFYRLNTEEIGSTVTVNFDIKSKSYYLTDCVLNISIDLLKIKAVYFRRPEPRVNIEDLSDAENTFVTGEIIYTLEAIYKILKNAHWVNNIENIRSAENKIYQLQIAQEIGFLIPDSLITSEADKAFSFYNKNERDCVIKPIKAGLVSTANHEEGVIFTSIVKLEDEDVNRINICPTYLQTHIHKAGDIRVTIIGNELFSVFIHSQEFEDSKVDWRNHQGSLKHTLIDLPTSIRCKCFNLVKALSLNFGAIDLILTKTGDYVFLEINPNGQWAWIERILGLNISEAIINFMIKDIIDEAHDSYGKRVDLANA